MNDAYSYQEGDLGVLFIPPLSASDIRVPTAEEMTLAELISTKLKANPIPSDRLWREYPQITHDDETDLVTVIAEAISPYDEKKIIAIDFAVQIPGLEFAETQRISQFYLVSLLIEEGQVHDAVLGSVSFQYDTPTGETITTPNRENTRRLREKYLLMIKTDETALDQLFTGMESDPDGSMYLNVADFSADQGVQFAPNVQIYDPSNSWLPGIRYKLPLKEQGVVFYPLGTFYQYKNIAITGYSWQENQSMQIDYNFGYSSLVENRNLINLAYRLMEGQPLRDSAYSLEVGNLISGEAPVAYTQPGYGIISPNGDLCLANDQRISFTNERRAHRQYFQRVVAIADNDATLISATLNTNSPQGTIFSEEASEHRIYSLDGLEQSEAGRFLGLGADNNLLWYGGGRSTISPGDEALIVPSVYYGAGAGFKAPILNMESVYVNNEQIDAANIRFGLGNDLCEYEDPIGNPNAPYFVIYGTERNAIHYILKKITITSDENGTVLVPNTEFGNIVFIQGFPTRWDRPVVTGLLPNTDYDCLIYYPPRNFEIWQFQYKSIPYQGKGEIYLDFLTAEMEIEAAPFFFVHGNGGGNSTFLGDPRIVYRPIATFLPSLDGDVPSYSLSGPIYYQGESPSAPQFNMRELKINPASEYTLPRKGMRIKFVPDPANTSQDRSLAGKLVDGYGATLGFQTPEHGTTLYYQYVMFLLVRQGDTRKMLVTTHITNGTNAIGLDSNSQTAIDIFEV